MENIFNLIIEQGIYFLSAKDVRENGVIFDNPLYISKEDAKKFRKRCNPEKGDILMVSRGATVGRSCLINSEELFCLLGSVILIKLNPLISNQYLIYILKSPYILRKLINISGSTAQQAIYLRDIKKIMIPLPSYDEQLKIAEEVTFKFSLIDKEEEIINKTLKQAQRLRQSILKKAFEGKLVPQDQADETCK